MKRACFAFAILLLASTVFAQPPKSATDLTYTPTIVEKPEVRLLDQEGAGKLYQVGAQLVCVMEGTPDEMGFQHGRLMGARMARGATKGLLQKAVWGKGYSKEYVKAQCERMERHIPAECIAEMKGIVKGLKAAGVAEISYEDIRLIDTQGEILHYPPGAGPQCSNFACWGRWTPDGRLLHGRNLDWTISENSQDYAVILVWRPKGGIPFMMVTWAGAVGGVSGMNAEGITIGEMTDLSTSITYDGMPLFILMRHVLEKSSDLATAVGIVEKGPRTIGWNFVIGDGKIPDARALDTDATTCEVFAPMDEKENVGDLHSPLPDAVRRTNHPVCMDHLLKLAQAIGPRMGLKIESMDQLKAALPFFKMQNTYQRYVWLGKQIQAHPKGIDVKEALQLLSNGPVFQKDTLHSWVFDPKNQVAYVSVAGDKPAVTATRRPYTRIELGQWFSKALQVSQK